MPKTTGATYYLGAEPDKTRRREALNALAAQWGVTAGALLQMLADGVVELRPAVIDSNTIKRYRRSRKRN